MEYSKTYFLRYLSANEEVRKASKDHWLRIHAAHIVNGDMDSDTYSLSASILAAIAVADDLIAKQLEPYGFNIRFISSNGTKNLLAFHGTGAPLSLFLGHTDVVPTGDENIWDYPPFSGKIITKEDGKHYLYGRGSSDMKGGDAAMICAMIEYIEKNPDHKGTIDLLLTSNEEGDAVGGTPYVVEFLKKENIIPDYCIIGECSCDEVFGDSIKNGRRGDLNATIVVNGIQGHAALEQHAKNAVFEASRFKYDIYGCGNYGIKLCGNHALEQILPQP